MMKHIFYLFIFITLLLGACKNIQEGKQKSDINFVQIKKVPDNKLNFFDITEDYKFIKLETNEESLLGSIDKLLFTEERIFVLDRTTQSLFSFDQKGNFVKQIGKKGKGPGEWYQPNYFNIDEENDRLVVNCRETRKLLYFTYDGNFIKEIDTGLRFRSMEYINEDTIFIVAHRILNVLPDSDELAYDLICFNLDMEILHKQFPNNLVLGKSAGTFTDNKYLYKSDHGIFLNFYFNDTIYKIGDGSLRADPFLHIDFGEKRVDYNELYQDEEHAYVIFKLAEDEKRAMVDPVMVAGDHMIIQYAAGFDTEDYHNKDRIIYNLNTGDYLKFSDIIYSDNSNCSWHYPIGVHGEYFVSQLHPLYHEISCILDNDVRSLLSEDDWENQNPVLLLYKFKDFF